MVADSRLRGLLFEYFCYFFALIAFSHGDALQLHLAQCVFNSPLLAGNDNSGLLLGRQCREVFSCILKVATLVRRTAHVSPKGNHLRVAELKSLEAQLGSWSGIPPQIDGTALSPEHAISELYRLACVIHIRKTLDQDDTGNSSDIQQLLAQFIVVLDRLPPTSTANGILCWPLVVAGMASTIATHRRLIVGRLRAIYKIWRSEILTQSVNMLFNSWREEKDANGLRMRTAHPTYAERAVEFDMCKDWFNCPVVLL